MTLVRFAMLCDVCRKRSEEYTAWPSCRGCQRDVCYGCMADGTKRGGDGDPESVLCLACTAEYGDDEETA